MNTCVAILAAAVLCSNAMAAVDPMASGDAAFLGRAAPAQAMEALSWYRKARLATPQSAEAAWRVAMAAQFVGYRLTSEREQKLILFAEGRDAATEASVSAPDCAPCHFWAGINRALYGEASGIFRAFATLGIVRQNLTRAAELDPSYAHGGPDRVLGLIDQKLPGILGGSNSDAVQHFEKAIAAASDNPLNYLFLAQLYREEYKDEAAVRRVWERSQKKVRLPPASEIESIEAWNELKQLGASFQK